MQPRHAPWNLCKLMPYAASKSLPGAPDESQEQVYDTAENNAGFTTLTLEERQQLGEALHGCTGSFKRLVSPLLPYPRVLSYLHRTLQECIAESGGSSKEATLTLALRMEEPGAKQAIEDLRDLMKMEPELYEAEKLQDEWIADFQNQVDYVPGLSKGKRLLSVEETEQFVMLGAEMKDTGNRAFAAKDFEMALTRYTQGVELLSNVKCQEDDREVQMQALRINLLTNQAAAALRVESFRVAVSACTTCLIHEPLNLKARLRRAEALRALGELEEAKKDLAHVMTLTEADIQDSMQLLDAKRKARREMVEIGGLEGEEKATARRIIQGASKVDWEGGREKTPAPTTVPSPYPRPQPSVAAKSVGEKRETLVDEATALALQEELRGIYKEEKVQVELMQMRRDAEYEEIRFLRRLRPFLLRAVAPVLERHGFGEGEEGYRHMEKAIAQHLSTCATVKHNAKELLAMLMGDLGDM